MRVFLIASLLLNAALAALWFWSAARQQQAPTSSTDTPLPSDPAAVMVVRTNTIVRHQNFSWHQVESPDYRVFIENLRLISVPEATIRDIIISEINQLYANKRATNVVTPDQQWWRSEPDPRVVQAGWAQMNALEDERRALLKELLGANWERASSPALQSFSGLQLNGPILGNLTAEARTAVTDINSRAGQRMQAYLQHQAQAGKTADPAELARLNQMTRDELGKVLSATELEEYLLRYSQTARNLRNEFRGVELSPEEFRAMFRAQELVDRELSGLPGDEAGSVSRRQELERQRELALQASLAPEKYQSIRLNRDPLFRDARTTVEQFGAPAEAVIPLYEVNQAVEAERLRIRHDVSLSDDDKELALAEAQALQRNTMRRLLGDEAYARFLASEEAKQKFLRAGSAGD